MAEFSWAYIDSEAVVKVAGPTGSVQYRVADADGHTVMSGTQNFVYHTASNQLAVTGEVSASFLVGDGSGLTNVGGGGSPAGSVNEIQFNNGAGAFAASANLSYDGTTLTSSTHVPTGDATVDLGSETLKWNKVYAEDVISDLNGAVRFTAKNDEGAEITKGQAVYIKGISGNTPTVALAAADDPSKMPAFGLVHANANDQASVEIVTLGTLYTVNTLGCPVGESIYVATGSGGTSGSLNPVAPTGSSQIQNIGMCMRQHNSAGSIKVGGAGRANATPNLDEGYIFVGNGTDQSVADNTIYVSSSVGRVGINTTAPSHDLTVNGNVSASAYIGNGSGLTNLPASDPFPYAGNAGISGTLDVSGSISRHGFLQLGINAEQSASIANLNTVTPSGLAFPVNWNDVVRKDTAFYSHVGSVITLVEAGDYKITYSANFSQMLPDNARSNMKTYLEKSPSGGASFAELPYSHAYSYLRGSGDVLWGGDGSTGTTRFGTNTATTIVTGTAANDELRLQFLTIGGIGYGAWDMRLPAYETWITIEKI